MRFREYSVANDIMVNPTTTLSSKGTDSSRMDNVNHGDHEDMLTTTSFKAIQILGEAFNATNPRKDLRIDLEAKNTSSTTDAISFIVGLYQQHFPKKWEEHCEELARQLREKSTPGEAGKFLQELIDDVYPDYLQTLNGSCDSFDANRQLFHPEIGDFGGVAHKDTPEWYRKRFPSPFEK